MANACYHSNLVSKDLLVFQFLLHHHFHLLNFHHTLIIQYAKAFVSFAFKVDALECILMLLVNSRIFQWVPILYEFTIGIISSSLTFGITDNICLKYPPSTNHHSFKGFHVLAFENLMISLIDLSKVSKTYLLIPGASSQKILQVDSSMRFNDNN